MPNPGSETEHTKDFGASIIVIRVATNLNTHLLNFCPIPKKKKKEKKKEIQICERFLHNQNQNSTSSSSHVLKPSIA
jgi:hypothetical protein